MNALTEITAAAPTVIDQNAIRASVGDLRRAVAQVAMIVQRRNTIPVLGCLLVKPGKGKLEITGTDLDSLVAVECPADCGKKARPFIIAAPLLKNLLAGAEAGDPVEITRGAAERNDMGDILTLKVGPAMAQVRELCSADDFPSMAEPTTEAIHLTAKAETLASAIINCRPCVSTEETRYYLNGIYLHARNGALAGAATDGHRLSLYQTDTPWPLAGQIVPRGTLGVLAHLLGKAGDANVTVTGWGDANRLRIAGSGWTLTFKTIDGTFPDYTRVIPERSPDAGYAILSPATLRRVPVSLHPGASRYMRSSERCAALDLENGSLTTRDRCDGLEFVLPIEAKGKFTVWFNINYLRALTHAFGTVRIEMTGTGNAATVLSSDPNWLGVIMPMHM